MDVNSTPNAARRDFVFEQINGAFALETVDGVKNETLANGRLAEAIAEVFQARDNLCLHSGIDAANDRDLDDLMSAYEKLCYQCGILMYDHGWNDGQNTPAG